MADIVSNKRTSLQSEEVIVRAVQFFSTAKWRATSQSPRAATFEGKIPIPWFMILLTVLGFIFCLIPGFIMYFTLIRKLNRFQNLVVTATPQGSGTEVVLTYAYTNDQVYIQTNELGLVTTNTWDALGRLLRIDFPASPGIPYTFITNTYGNLDLVQTIDRMGFTNSYGYDPIRRLIAVTNALGKTTYYNYCSCGALNSIEDAAGNYTYFSYNSAGWLTNVLYPDGYSVSSSYDLLGRVTNTIDSGGFSITNWFNNQGLKYESDNYFGRIFNRTLDIEDRVATNTDANGVGSVMTYDNLGRVLTRAWPDGGVEAFRYTNGALVVYTNQLTNVTRYVYDAGLRKTSETNANNELTQFSYDAAGDLLTLTDAKTNVTTWHYDMYGDVTNKLDANSNVVLAYYYDADQRLTNRYSAAKNNTSYFYDKVGNLTNVAYPVSPSISLAYDALNRLTNMLDALGTTYYSYDQVGQLLSEDGPWPDDTVRYMYNNRMRASLSLQGHNSSPWLQAYAYDGARRLTNTTSPAGGFGYAYDGTRQLKVHELSLPGGAYISCAYDSVARMLTNELFNSSGTILNAHNYGYNVGNQRTNQTFLNGNYENYTYDNIGQLTSALGAEAGGTPLRVQEQLQYSYDAAHNLSIRTNDALVQTFTVNDLNELSNATHSGTLTVAGTTSSSATTVHVNGSVAERYADVTFARGGFGVTNGNNTFTAIASDSLGRSSTNSVTVFLPGTNSFNYDLNGNLLSDGYRTFTYDDENELTSVVVSNGISTPTLTSNIYDGKMRRRIRKDYVWQGAWVQSAEVHYVYDGNVVIQERDGNNLPLVSYTRGNDLSGSLQGAGGIGGLLARTDNSLLTVNSPLSTSYYHADGNGNITSLISFQQYIQARYVYDPFGNIASQSGALADANTCRYSSKEFDKNTGLAYCLYRFYDPNLQRWINRDPMTERGFENLRKHRTKRPIKWLPFGEQTEGPNMFAYVRNDPQDLLDPVGLGMAGFIPPRGTPGCFRNNCPPGRRYWELEGYDSPDDCADAEFQDYYAHSVFGHAILPGVLTGLLGIASPGALAPIVIIGVPGQYVIFSALCQSCIRN